MLKTASATLGKLFAVMALGWLALGTAYAQSAQASRIAWLSPERIYNESRLAKLAGDKLKEEFSTREKAMNELGARLKSATEKYSKEEATLGEVDRAVEPVAALGELVLPGEPEVAKRPLGPGDVLDQGRELLRRGERVTGAMDEQARHVDGRLRSRKAAGSVRVARRPRRTSSTVEAGRVAHPNIRRASSRAGPAPRPYRRCWRR